MLLKQEALISCHCPGTFVWKFPLVLQRVLRSFTVTKQKWYTETSKLLTYCLIRWVSYHVFLDVMEFILITAFWSFFFFFFKWQNYGAKLSDFGLAKDGPTGDQSHVSTRVMGTKGYAAPEYMATGIFSIDSFVRFHIWARVCAYIDMHVYWHVSCKAALLHNLIRWIWAVLWSDHMPSCLFYLLVTVTNIKCTWI